MKNFLRLFFLTVCAGFIGTSFYFMAPVTALAAENTQKPVQTGIQTEQIQTDVKSDSVITHFKVSHRTFNPDLETLSIQFSTKNAPLNTSYDVTIIDAENELYEVWTGRVFRNGSCGFCYHDDRLPSGLYTVTVSLRDPLTRKVVESHQTTIEAKRK